MNYVRLRDLGRNNGSLTGRSHILDLRGPNEVPFTACGLGVNDNGETGDLREPDPSAPVCGQCKRRKVAGGAA